MTITNMSGRTIKNFASLYDFLPVYTDEEKAQLKEKSIDQQVADDIAFGEKLKSIQNGN